MTSTQATFRALRPGPDALAPSFNFKNAAKLVKGDPDDLNLSNLSCDELREKLAELAPTVKALAGMLVSFPLLVFTVGSLAQLLSDHKKTDEKSRQLNNLVAKKYDDVIAFLDQNKDQLFRGNEQQYKKMREEIVALKQKPANLPPLTEEQNKKIQSLKKEMELAIENGDKDAFTSSSREAVTFLEMLGASALIGFAVPAIVFGGFLDGFGAVVDYFAAKKTLKAMEAAGACPPVSIPAVQPSEKTSEFNAKEKSSSEFRDNPIPSQIPNGFGVKPQVPVYMNENFTPEEATEVLEGGPRRSGDFVGDKLPVGKNRPSRTGDFSTNSDPVQKPRTREDLVFGRSNIPINVMSALPAGEQPIYSPYLTPEQLKRIGELNVPADITAEQRARVAQWNAAGEAAQKRFFEETAPLWGAGLVGSALVAAAGAAVLGGSFMLWLAGGAAALLRFGAGVANANPVKTIDKPPAEISYYPPNSTAPVTLYYTKASSRGTILGINPKTGVYDMPVGAENVAFAVYVDKNGKPYMAGKFDVVDGKGNYTGQAYGYKGFSKVDNVKAERDHYINPSMPIDTFVNYGDGVQQSANPADRALKKID